MELCVNFSVIIIAYIITVKKESDAPCKLRRFDWYLFDSFSNLVPSWKWWGSKNRKYIRWQRNRKVDKSPVHKIGGKLHNYKLYLNLLSLCGSMNLCGCTKTPYPFGRHGCSTGFVEFQHQETHSCSIKSLFQYL